ncbi:type II secretion system F family protein [Oricola cellulosilytica]|uniref:Type II secretion system F family protein n=1 Tax=Oricola cellulosilytica TaxID=1429082 RepID=A0A4R0PHC3_9HYPH|nr:type II secretion system F family protein [Oricola cellulosilytica]TCD16184.1 type II secretion system F family protein [Oricola cellulosilytica]
MSLPFIYFTVFLFTIIFLDTVIRLAATGIARRRYINYRVKLLEGNADRKQIYERMLKERSVRYGEDDSLSMTLARYFAQANIRTGKTRLVLYVVSIFVLFLLAADYLLANPALVLVAALVGPAGVVTIYVSVRRSRRIKHFLVQLPDAIDVMIRSLAAGHPLPSSVSLVAREMPDPIGSEFGIMADEMTYGTDIDAATRNMVVRVGAEDLNFLAISLSVQRGSGGNLTEILKNLSDMLRKRTMMKAKIRAISAEGRWTAWFMLGFPFYLYGIINFLAPTYFDPIWESGYGTLVVTAGLGIMTVGMLVVRKLVNFDF